MVKSDDVRTSVDSRVGREAEAARTTPPCYIVSERFMMVAGL